MELGKSHYLRALFEEGAQVVELLAAGDEEAQQDEALLALDDLAGRMPRLVAGIPDHVHDAREVGVEVLLHVARKLFH